MAFWLLLTFCLHFLFCLQKPHAKSHELYLEAVEEPQFILGVKRTVTAVGLFVKNLFRAISESWSCKKFLLQFLDSFLLVMNLHNLLGVNKQFWDFFVYVARTGYSTFRTGYSTFHWKVSVTVYSVSTKINLRLKFWILYGKKWMKGKTRTRWEAK